MKVEESLLQEAQELLEANARTIREVEDDIVSVGCSFCGLGCSGIVGG